MQSLDTNETLIGESEPVSELPEEELADTPRGALEYDEEVPPPLDTAPEPTGEHFAEEGKIIHYDFNSSLD